MKRKMLIFSKGMIFYGAVHLEVRVYQDGEWIFGLVFESESSQFKLLVYRSFYRILSHGNYVWIP